MTKPKAPSVPAPRTETVRQAIITLLLQGWMTARDLSTAVGISEKLVADHLEHVRKSAGHEQLQLAVEPAECLHCGFVFRKRDRLQTPGKCPACRSEAVSDPRFSLVSRS